METDDPGYVIRLRLRGDAPWEPHGLSGPIPPELGKLGKLTELDLANNHLSGPIPPELGNLSRLIELHLGGNALSGPLPEALRDPPSLSALYLRDNNLTGSIPAKFGQMLNLRELALSNNEEMAGPLPSELTSLRNLAVLVAGGTDLCAPLDPDFQTWLERVTISRVAPCVDDDPPMAYLTQGRCSRGSSPSRWWRRRRHCCASL